jgi:Arc/MetJ-type ribon-helix-helix transcriptional regulator
MPIQLKPEQEHRIEEALRSGAYGSQEEVIDRALDALHAQDEWLTANRQAIDAKIRTGIQELEQGEGIPEEDLDEYLVHLKAQPE